MTNNKPLRLLACGVLAAAVSGQSFAAEYSPSVTIRTRATPAGETAATGDNRVVPGVEVQFWEDEGLFNNLLDTVETDSNGVATTTFQSANDPDIFVVVVLVFNSIDGKKVRVRDEGSAADLDATSGTWNAIAAGATDLGTFNLPDNKANIGTEARDCLKQMNAAYGAYAMPRDMIAYASDRSSASGVGDYIRLAEEEYHDPGEASGGSFSVIHHETAHWIHLNEYQPGGEVVSPHHVPTESNTGFALVEGWAEFVAWQTAVHDHANKLDTYTFGGKDYHPEFWWRGYDQTGTDNAGDIVEGAIFRSWATENDLAGTFKVILDDHPSDIREWLDGFGTDKNWDIDDMFYTLEENGIPLTRALIDAFDTVQPPDDAPELPGNADLLEEDGHSVQYLRGTVKPFQILRDDVNLTVDTIKPEKYRIGYKVAADGLDQAMTVNQWTWLEAEDWGESVNWADDDYPIDTTQIKDGAYDVAVQTMNPYDYWEHILPEFFDDAEESRNTDEKWLKSRGTWFNQDGDPDNNYEGKVVIDNTQPEVDENARKPPPN